MQLHDYMKYIDMACWMACIPRYQWTGRTADRKSYSLAKKSLFIFGVICLIYQIFGQITYLYKNGRKEQDTETFVAVISETFGSLMLTTVGFANIYALMKNRHQIEIMFEELHKIYPRIRDKHFRCQHYYDMAILIMKIEFMFYMVFYVYYNSAPLFVLYWEYLQEEQDLSFKMQTNTWFPWKVQGSTIGFGMALLSISLASFVGVGFSIATLNIVCIFTFQLKLHYDGMASQLMDLDSRQSGAHEKLRNLIAYHFHILKMGDQFNQILNFIFGSSLVGSTIAICMTSVAVLLLDVGSAFKYIIGLIAFVLYHFVICYMGTEVAFAMELEDFMWYQDLVCQVSQLPRFEWSGRRFASVERNLAKRIIFLCEAVNLLYHNIGCIMYGYFVVENTHDPIEYLAEMAAVGSMLGFTILGTLNLWQILKLKPHVEELLKDFEELFQFAKQKPYRTRHYHESYTSYVKIWFIIYTFSVVYYNLQPFILMIWEHLKDSPELSYQIQSGTWYPWRIQGSITGFLVAIICQGFSCQVIMCSILLSQFLISFFGIQLEIHFDGLASRLKGIDARYPIARDQLTYLIVYHSKLFNLADRVNRLFNFTFFVSFSLSIISMCFLANCMTMFDLVSGFKHLLGLLIFLIYNFSMCRNGTHLIYASDKVLPAAFYNNWYEGDLSYRRTLLILMMRATKTYTWRTYKLTPVSITTYMATLKFSYQMFTCVRSMK
ncbi:putative odorant receptor 69a [Drosophila eugracilis]|uniref:putative odorant receptor 69a n=1 Tax=Drosophila eugracilis TaxID=29029 RepID=UPI0007E88EA3|nr:putative odorant receptor 69a [Drosophila eugracilis]